MIYVLLPFKIDNFLRDESVKIGKNGKNGHFGDPENPEKNGSYQKKTDLLICLDQIFQKSIPGV